MEGILSAIAALLNTIWIGLKKALEVIVSVISSIWNRIIDIKEAITGVIKYSINWVKKLLTDTVDFFLWLWNLIIDFFPWLINLLKQILKAALNLAHDLFSTLFENILDLVIYLLNAIPGLETISALLNIDLPSEITGMMGLIGIGTATEIIVTAIIIRIFLQLVPFTRLGS